MAEVGARPKVHPARRKALGAVRSLFTPLLPDDYLELINPLWSTQELRGRVEGDFTLPEPRPDKPLFISAGSGVTPIMSMLRALDQEDKLDDAVLVHSARHPDDVIFCDFLMSLDERSEGFHLHLQLTEEQGRISPEDLEQICPDWRERETFLSGPSDMLDAMEDYWEREGDRERLHMERFQPKVGFTEEGEGGEISFLASDKQTEADGGTPILVAGEECGLDLAYGCREGICHTCTGKLCSGKVRDLRNGNVYGTEGEMIRVCISAPEGPVEVDL